MTENNFSRPLIDFQWKRSYESVFENDNTELLKQKIKTLLNNNVEPNYNIFNDQRITLYNAIIFNSLNIFKLIVKIINENHYTISCSKILSNAFRNDYLLTKMFIEKNGSDKFKSKFDKINYRFIRFINPERNIITEEDLTDGLYTNLLIELNATRVRLDTEKSSDDLKKIMLKSPQLKEIFTNLESNPSIRISR